MKFFAHKKQDTIIAEQQVINEDLMQRILFQIRNMSAQKLKEQGCEIHDLSHVSFRLDPVKWEDIPCQYGAGVTMLKIPFEQPYVKKAAVVFKPGAEIFPHFSNTCHEIIHVEKGSIIDKMVNDSYGPGSIYYIPKGASHHICSTEGAYLTIYYVFDDKYQSIINKLKAE